MRLTSALQESTANVDEWKRQLQSYKEENQRLKNKYIELEASKGSYLLLGINVTCPQARVSYDRNIFSRKVHS